MFVPKYLAQRPMPIGTGIRTIRNAHWYLRIAFMSLDREVRRVPTSKSGTLRAPTHCLGHVRDRVAPGSREDGAEDVQREPEECADVSAENDENA